MFFEFGDMWSHDHAPDIPPIADDKMYFQLSGVDEELIFDTEELYWRD